MHDQKESPLERTIYWIEYVIRHRGAQHLRSPSRHLTIFQRDLFDITLIAILFIIAAAYVVVCVVGLLKRAANSYMKSLLTKI